MRARAMRKALLFIAILGCTGRSSVTGVDAGSSTVVIEAARHDTSAPLRDLVAYPAPLRLHDDEQEEGNPFRKPLDAVRARAIDPLAQQTTVLAATVPTPTLVIEGLGAGMPNGGAYLTPGDPAIAVGSTQVMEIVNSSIAVWDKSGTLLLGPKWTNSIWGGFGGVCETSNEGDGRVRYDALANRWVISQFVYYASPHGVCVAISATSDATGAWNRYYFPFQGQPDYPLIGVWPDAYYLTINGILTGDNLDTPVCALDRAKMLTGAQATMQCFSTAARAGVPSPGDVTGTTPPPAGSPELIAMVDRTTGTQIDLWKLHIDWTTPAQSTLTGPSTIPVAQFAYAPTPTQPNGVAFNAGGNAFPLAYRNFGDHEAFVFTDEVASNSLAAVRWYELRGGSSAPTLYQQGTYAPADGVHRFMSSTGIDKLGNIALGYAVTSPSVYPGIRFTGRLAGDALGQMTLGEGKIVDGAGSQTGNRWGDYSDLSVDPVDGCTFWYAHQYIADASGTWHTKAASFTLPGCSGSTPPPSVITNGDFETGSLAPWTTTGSASISTTAHGGTKAAMVGSTGPTTDSSIAQTFTAPAAGGTLSFWYKVTCPDSVSYDWATATLKDNTATTTTTPLPKTCSNTGAWVQVTAALVGNHSYTLTLANHDDNYAGDATYTIFDDVTVAAATTPPPSPIVNGDFETGALTPWASAGTTSISTTAHGGRYAAQGGKVGVTVKGDSSVTQSFTAPASGGTLTFWYRVVCLDTVTYDWATATLKDTTSGTTTTPLAKKCSNTGSWAQVSATLVAGHAYTLTLTSHDDGYSNADATYTLFDDVTVK